MSLIIFASIISQLPASFGGATKLLQGQGRIGQFSVLVLMFFLMIVGIIMLSRVREESQYSLQKELEEERLWVGKVHTYH